MKLFSVVLVLFLSLFVSAQDNSSSGNKVGEIQEGQTGKYKRRYESLNLTAIGFGPYSSTNIGGNKALFGLSYGKVWEASDIWDIRFDLMGAANSDGSFFSAGFGPSYILSSEQVSPFIGFELGAALADGNSTNKGSYFGQLNAGLKMFRLADTQIELLGTYSTIFGSDSLSIYGLQLRLLF